MLLPVPEIRSSQSEQALKKGLHDIDHFCDSSLLSYHTRWKEAKKLRVGKPRVR